MPGGSWPSQGLDRGALQRRPDVLVYTSDPLAEAVDILGDVTVELVAASDALDTDFAAVLSDVAPDCRCSSSAPGSRSVGPAIGTGTSGLR